MSLLNKLFKRDKKYLTSNEYKDVLKTVNYFKVYFNNKDFIDDGINDIFINSYETNIYNVNNTCHLLLVDEDTMYIRNLIYNDNIKSIYLTDFFTNEYMNLKISNTNFYMVILEYIIQLLELYSNYVKSVSKFDPKVLYMYIINMLDIYRDIYNRYERG